MYREFKIERTVAPTDLVVSLSEAKTYLAVGHSDHDSLITDIIKAATDLAETYTYMVLPQATFKMYLNDFYDTLIPRVPIIAISSVQYYDGSGTLQTLPAAGYELDLISKPAKIHWDSTPTVRDNEYNNVVITFTAGHTSVATISSGIKQAIKVVIADMYDQRSSSSNQAVNMAALNYHKLFDAFQEKFYI